MAKRAAAGGLVTRLRARAKRNVAPNGAVSQTESPRTDRPLPAGSWFPPDDETATSWRERQLADQRALALTMARDASRRPGRSGATTAKKSATAREESSTTTEEGATTTEESSTTAEESSTTAEESSTSAEEIPGVGEAVANGSQRLDETTEPAGSSAGATVEPTHWVPSSEPPHPDSESTARWVPMADQVLRDQKSQTENETLPTITERVGAEAVLDAAAPTVTSQRQIYAVEAYCRELCPPDTATLAAAESLRTFNGGHDLDLLRHTRTVAAKHAVRPPIRHARLPSFRGARDGGCELTPPLLAAMANGELDGARGEALERHIDSCVTCQAAEVRARCGERVFAGVTTLALPAEAAAAARQEAVVVDKERTASGASEIAAASATLASSPSTALEEKWVPSGPQPSPAYTTKRVPSGPQPSPAYTTKSPAIPQAAPAAERESRPRSRGRLVAVLGAAAGLAAGAALAVVLLTSSSSTHRPLAGATPVSTTAALRPAHNSRPHPAARRHPAARSATHHAAPAAPAAAADAASASTPAATPSSSSAAPASSAPASSSPPASSAPAPSSSPSSPPPSVSIQQPSLGSANAPQGVGK